MIVSQSLDGMCVFLTHCAHNRSEVSESRGCSNVTNSSMEVLELWARTFSQPKERESSLKHQCSVDWFDKHEFEAKKKFAAQSRLTTQWARIWTTGPPRESADDNHHNISGIAQVEKLDLTNKNSEPIRTASLTRLSHESLTTCLHGT